MSQIIVPVSGGALPPAVPTTFQEDSGSAVPVANVLNVLGDDTSVNDFDGLTTTGSGNTVTVLLTNRIVGTATTTDAVTPQTLSTFSLGATPATYLFDITILAYNVTDSLSAGYTSSSVLRTTGAAASEINADPGLITEEGAMTGVVVQNQISGNSFETVVTGLAGKSINWRSLITYTMVT